MQLGEQTWTKSYLDGLLIHSCICNSYPFVQQIICMTTKALSSVELYFIIERFFFEIPFSNPAELIDLQSADRTLTHGMHKACGPQAIKVATYTTENFVPYFKGSNNELQPKNLQLICLSSMKRNIQNLRQRTIDYDIFCRSQSPAQISMFVYLPWRSKDPPPSQREHYRINW